jgi:hypothetical protein
MSRPSTHRFVKTFTRATMEIAKSACRWLRDVWYQHCELLRTNASYAATVGAAAASVFTQLNGRDLVAAAITAVVAVWTAVRHPGARRSRYDDLSVDLADMDRWR